MLFPNHLLPLQQLEAKHTVCSLPKWTPYLPHSPVIIVHISGSLSLFSPRVNKWKDAKGKEGERKAGRRGEGGGGRRGEQGKRRMKRRGRREKRDERKGRLATCPSMGDVEDAEDSLAWARGQGHMCPWLQEDGCGAVRMPQEPVQVGGLTALDKGQIQSGARCPHPGVWVQPSRDCREAGGRGPLQQDGGPLWLSSPSFPIFRSPVLLCLSPPLPVLFGFVLSPDECGCCSPAGGPIIGNQTGKLCGP